MVHPSVGKDLEVKTLLPTTARLQLCRESGLLIDKQIFRPDKTTAYVECFLSHSFPVVTLDETALHPQVVANSYRSMLHKVFDLAHLMKSYDPRNKRDHILGTIVAVEFPETPEGGWKVQGDKAKAPGIRAVACMHKQAESVQQILQQYFTGAMDWTVSMEQEFQMSNSGFLVRLGDENPEGKDRDAAIEEGFHEKTPEDLRALGWTYIPSTYAPIQKCFDDNETKVIKKYRGCETIALLGGLDGTIQYMGIGLTPRGKEKEAEVSQMLAGEKMIEVNGVLMPDVIGLLERTATLPD